MGKYGSGVSFCEACQNDKESIKHALKLEDWDCDTGRIVQGISMREAEDIILSAYDQAVYMALQFWASEKAIVELTGFEVKNNDELMAYMEAHQKALRETDYVFEIDKKEELER